MNREKYLNRKNELRILSDERKLARQHKATRQSVSFTEDELCFEEIILPKSWADLEEITLYNQQCDFFNFMATYEI